MVKKFRALLSAAGLAQLIGFLSLPVISRMVTPESFGLFYFYSSIAGLAGGLATARIEQLFFGETPGRALTLRDRSLRMVLWATLVSLLVIGIGLYGCSPADPIGWLLVPLGVFATGALIPNYFLLLKLGDFHALGGSRVLQAIIQAAGQIGLCLLFPGHIALFCGMIAGQLAGAIFLHRSCRRRLGRQDIAAQPVSVDIPRLLYGAGASSLNTLNTSFIPTFFALFQYLELSGLVAALHRILMIPVNLMAAALSHVVLNEYEQRPRAVRDTLWWLTGGVMLAIVLALASSTYLEPLLVWFLGESWRPAAELLRYFVPLYGMVFLGVVVNQACVAANMQFTYLLAETAKLGAVLAAFLLAGACPRLEIIPVYAGLVATVSGLAAVLPLLWIGRPKPAHRPGSNGVARAAD